MSALDDMAERRIREAQENGDFDDLPGAGAPLEFGEDALVPEELRAGYRLLKNAGFLPPELEARQEVRKLEQLLETMEDEAGRSVLFSRINFLLACGRRNNPQVESAYYNELVAALKRRRGSKR